MQTRVHESPAGGLDLGRRELVVAMGGGRKTGALRPLARELGVGGRRIVATTTAALFLRELSAVGRLVTGPKRPGLMAGLGRALAEGASVRAARGSDDRGKAIGIPSDSVERLWVMSAAGKDSGEPAGGAADLTEHPPALADYLLVEADGSSVPRTTVRPGGRPLALVKGAGDLASGVAVRLYRSGFDVVMTEIARPTAVRRTVAFAEAVYEGRTRVEGIEAVKADNVEEVRRLLVDGRIPVVVDAEASIRREVAPALVVDGILAKRNLGTSITDAPAVVALGPGFTAGVDAHAVVETKRGHTLGRVINRGEAYPDTGVPGEVGGFGEERVLRAPVAGVFDGAREIGAIVAVGEIVGKVGDIPVRARVEGVLRGLLHSGLEVTGSSKLGDIDPRATRENCFLVSDKALAIAGGVLEAACGLLGGVCFVVDR